MVREAGIFDPLPLPHPPRPPPQLKLKNRRGEIEKREGKIPPNPTSFGTPCSFPTFSELSKSSVRYRTQKTKETARSLQILRVIEESCANFHPRLACVLGAGLGINGTMSAGDQSEPELVNCNPTSPPMQGKPFQLVF